MSDSSYPGQKPEGWTPPEGQEKKGSIGKKLGIGCFALIGGVILLAVIGNALDDRTPEQKEADRQERLTEQAAEDQADAEAKVSSAREVTANELFNAFAQNEVAAQAAYGDQDLLVSGTIDRIELDFADEPVVSLRTSNQFQSVRLDFDNKDASTVSTLRSGQQITALCGDLTEVIGTPMLDDCTIQ